MHSIMQLNTPTIGAGSMYQSQANPLNRAIVQDNSPTFKPGQLDNQRFSINLNNSEAYLGGAAQSGYNTQLYGGEMVPGMAMPPQQKQRRTLRTMLQPQAPERGTASLGESAISAANLTQSMIDLKLVKPIVVMSAVQKRYYNKLSEQQKKHYEVGAAAHNGYLDERYNNYQRTVQHFEFKTRQQAAVETNQALYHMPRFESLEHFQPPGAVEQNQFGLAVQEQRAAHQPAAAHIPEQQGGSLASSIDGAIGRFMAKSRALADAQKEQVLEGVRRTLAENEINISPDVVTLREYQLDALRAVEQLKLWNQHGSIQFTQPVDLFAINLSAIRIGYSSFEIDEPLLHYQVILNDVVGDEAVIRNQVTGMGMRLIYYDCCGRILVMEK